MQMLGTTLNQLHSSMNNTGLAHPGDLSMQFNDNAFDHQYRKNSTQMHNPNDWGIDGAPSAFSIDPNLMDGGPNKMI